MGISKVTCGKNFPQEFFSVVEIPADTDSVKYEIDKESGALFVDRIMMVSMSYPCNYGYIPQTLAKDGDSLDVLVIAPFPLVAGSVIACRALGVLKMEDESGEDAKIIAVPTQKVCPLYSDIQSVDDLPQVLRAKIEHFFEHYKDLEPEKWVKIEGWYGVKDAHHTMLSCREAVS